VSSSICKRLENEQKCMNLYAKQGDKVEFVAPEHDRDDYFDAGKNATKMLIKGGVYTVREMHGYDLFTFVELEQFPGYLFYATDFIDC